LKFTIPIAVTIETADPPRFLSVGWQNGNLVVWCEATPGEGVRTTLAAAMTGDNVPEDAEYIGAAQHLTLLDGDPFVAHVYGRRT
jgi:hypothetical protein